MAYLQLLTQETSAVEQNSSSRDGKKEDRKEEVTEVSMIQVMFGFCLPGRYSLVFINERHQLDSGVDLFFKRVFGNSFLMCRSEREEHAQNFNLLLGRLGKPATYYFSE